MDIGGWRSRMLRRWIWADGGEVAPGRTVLRTDEVLLGKYDIINQ